MLLAPSIHAGQDKFVGRRAALAKLDELLGVEGRPLVTIMGTAGLGKTRLALEFGRSWAGGPVIFCDLTWCRSLEDVLSQVCVDLGVSVQAGASQASALARIGERLGLVEGRLVILDNVEQIVSEAREALECWLDAAPGVFFLVTSRQRLSSKAEVLLELEPLSLPEGEGPEESASEAAELFTERALAIGVDCRQGDPEGRRVAKIVRLLDGIPLALELAAARLRVMTMAGLEARMSSRFKVLRASGGWPSPKWQTLWAALEWSWQLLDPWEQRCLTQCVLFRGGFTLEAAEGVVVLSDEAPEVIDAIQTLRDKSLIRAWVPQEDPESLRFGFFESVRDFVEAKRDPGDVADLERFVCWVIEEVERLGADLYGPDGDRMMGRVSVERENLVAAVRAAISLGERGLALRGLVAFDPLFNMRGPHTAYAALLDEALEMTGAIPEPLEALSLSARGRLHQAQGHLKESVEILTEADALARRSGDRAVEGVVATSLSGGLHEQCRWDEARLSLERAEAIFAEVRDPLRRGRALGRLAGVLYEMGHVEASRERMEEAVWMCREAGDRRNETLFLHNLAGVQKSLGDVTKARQNFEAALVQATAIGDVRLQALCLANLGSTALEEERLDAAAARLAEALEAFEALGEVRMAHLYRGNLGLAHHLKGDLASACRIYAAAARGLRQVGDLRHEGRILSYLGAAQAGLGSLDEARGSFERAGAVLTEAEHPHFLSALSLHKLQIDVAEGRLGDVRCEIKAVSEGDTEQVVGDELRLAIRLLDGAMEGAPETSLVVDVNGAAFRLPGAEKVSLGRRRAARRVLLALAHHRQKSPGQCLTVHELVDLGWPGEDLHPETGANRAYVMIAELRKLGLQGHLLNMSGGYLLDPSVEITIEEI